MDHTASGEEPNNVKFQKYLPYLGYQVGIKYSERNLVLKYCGSLHKYIQTEMEFLDIILGASYRYDVKIEQKFKQHNKLEFGSANPQQPKYGKGSLNSQNNQPQENQSKP